MTITRFVAYDHESREYVWDDNREPLSFDECEALGLDGTGRGGEEWLNPVVRRAVFQRLCAEPWLTGNADNDTEGATNG